MDIREIRRQRLTEWFADKPLPAKDRSYISQLIKGKDSFGERAAKRIENDYAMPSGYLSRPYEESDSDKLMSIADRREEKLLTLFRELPDSEKDHMVSLFQEKVNEYNKLFEELLKLRNNNR